MSLRAVPPLNPSASQKADDAFYAAHPAFVRPDGTRIPLSADDPKQEALRQEWLTLYGASGGKVKGASPVPKPPEQPVEPCPLDKTVTVEIVSLTFQSDQRDGAGKKLLRPSPGDFEDATSEFVKPEWQSSPSKSDPISHTKNLNVKVDIELKFTVDPPGCAARLTKVTGTGPDDYLTFEKDHSRSVKTETIKITGLVSKGTLPNHVDLLTGSIDWSVVVDGEEKSAGSTGTHTLYVTYAKPIGKVDSTVANVFEEKGKVQDVTEERLAFSVEAAKSRGISDEKECVDAVFEKLLDLGVVYSLGFRWLPGVNETGVTTGPGVDGQPTPHHYLWRCNANTAKGECHNIAAAFMLSCRILGVKDPFAVGYMYPWPSRGNNHPTYTKRGDSILGKYDERYRRSHSGEGHDDEFCLFIDGNNFVNNFEGVARYRTAVLYAIGEGRYDLYATSHKNSSLFYSEHDTDSKGKVTSHDLTKGGFELCFMSESASYCKKSYPWKTALTSYPQPAGWTLECAAFYWHE